MGVRDKSSIQRPRFHSLLHWEGSLASCLVLAKMAFYSAYIITPRRPSCYSQTFPFSFVNGTHMN
ncbi:mCG147037 [Mus musculus]|nr:mCG147037 [Mus musculus]